MSPVVTLFAGMVSHLRLPYRYGGSRYDGKEMASSSNSQCEDWLMKWYTSCLRAGLHRRTAKWIVVLDRLYTRCYRGKWCNGRTRSRWEGRGILAEAGVDGEQ